MHKIVTSVVLAGSCAAVLAVAGPADAAVAQRPVLGAALSVSAVAGALPRGADISVISTCAAGTALDRTATRAAEQEIDADGLDPHLRLTSREFWPAGTVSRYLVTSPTAADDVIPVGNAALCRGTVAASARTVSGRASTDLRVWGPAPATLHLVNATVELVGDPDAEDVYATVMTAAGVLSSTGSVRGALQAAQAVRSQDGVSVVAAVAETTKRVRRGHFVSMDNTYRYTADLTRTVADPTR